MIEGLRELLIGLTLLNVGALVVFVTVEWHGRRSRRTPQQDPAERLARLIEEADRREARGA